MRVTARNGRRSTGRVTIIACEQAITLKTPVMEVDER